MEAKRHQHQKAPSHQFKNDQRMNLLKKKPTKTSNEDPKYTHKRILNGLLCNISNITVK